MPDSPHLPLLPALSSFPWFGSLPLAVRKGMLAEADLIKLRPGAMLFRQGDPPGGLYAITHGSIKMSTLNRQGKEAILAILDVGAWFGEISLIDGQPRTHDATALGSVEVLALARPAFSLLMRQPEFASAVAVLLAARIRLLYAIVEDSALRSTRARIAHRLLLLAQGNPALTPGIRQRVPVSQESLAMMLGVTRQTLAKDLKLLAQQNAIRLGYGYIEVLSEPQLKALCEQA